MRSCWAAGRRDCSAPPPPGSAASGCWWSSIISEPGRKILISGGGRCNFTNLRAAPECFLSDNPHFARSALARYAPEDFLALVEAHGIAWHEKTLGQLFCDGSAKQIVAMLLAECEAGGVELAYGDPVRDVRSCRWPLPRHASARARQARPRW